MRLLLRAGHRLPPRLLLMALLTVGVVAGMASAPPVGAQGDEGPRLSIIVEALNVRAGPGVTYPVLDVLIPDQQVPVIGRHTPSGWWQVRLDSGLVGWVSGKAAYVRVRGDTSGVPQVAAPAPSAQPAMVTNISEGGTIVFQTASGGPIYVVNADGSGLRYLTTGIDPAVAPDGQRVAFTRWDDTQHGAFGSVWVINLDGTGERAIHGDVRQPKSPTWSPDGTQIAISMQEGGRLRRAPTCSKSLPKGPIEGELKDIRVVINEDGEVRFCYTLLPHPFWGLRLIDLSSGRFEDLPRDRFSYTPTWDPANAWHLVYDGEVGLVNLDINQGSTWALTDDRRDHNPAFSPDGSRLAVAYEQHDHWDIHVLNADGGGRMRLTETPLRAIVEQRLQGQEPRAWNNVAPAWSPDGSQIAFLSDRTGRWEIWLMGADGGNQRPLFPAGTPEGLGLQYHYVGERVLSWR